MSKSVLLRAAVALALSGVAGAQEIGANYNHDPEIIDLGLLRRTPVQWIRTTPYIFQYIQGQKSPETGEGLARLIAAHEEGYQVAFGFRWDFRSNKLPIPAPDSVEEKRYFDVARRILERVGGSIEIFTLGNEPNLETLDADLRVNGEGVVPLVRFTERLLTEVVEPVYRGHAEWRRPAVYVGSLPALFEARQQKSAGVLGLIELAQKNPAIAGLAIHLHIEGEADMKEAFEFTRRLLPAKPLLVPEFSLHRLYQNHLTDRLGDSEAGLAFAEKYGRPAEMKLHEWYSLANQQKVSAEEWAGLFASRSWFPPHFLKTYNEYFGRYGVRLATYGFMSQYAPAVVPANGMAWFINPIFPQKSLPLGEDGQIAANPLWFDDFVAIVEEGRARRK